MRVLACANDGLAHAPRRRRRAAGFTFIEMMVVIFIIGLMSALAVTNMGHLTARSTLSSEAHGLGNALLFLRDIALVQGRPMTLEIEVENQRWREIDRPGAAEFPDPDEREEHTFYGPWVTMEGGVVLDEITFGRSDFGNDHVLITFTEKGELFPSGFVAYFRHEDINEDDGISVEIAGLTGSVTYHRGRVEAEEVREASDF